MKAQKQREPSTRFEFKTWRDITPMQASVSTMLHNKTGSWRFIKPRYEDKTPACQNNCPAGNDIEGWIRLIEKKEFERAYWYLKQEEPFPAILGRVCFSFCEAACNRAAFDQHVSIRDLERFIGEQLDPSAPCPFPIVENHKSLAVIGSGPAGMSMAYFAKILGFQVTLYEKSDVPGGLLSMGIPDYRLPGTIVEAEFKGLAGLGINIRTGMNVGTDIDIKTLTDTYDYIFWATGAQKSLPLNLGGKYEQKRVMSGLQFLKLLASGNQIPLGRNVMVAGGGNTALDAARSAVRLGSNVTVVYRRTEAEMPAHQQEIREAKEEGVQFRFLLSPETVISKTDGTIRHILCREMELGPPDESGRRKPVPKSGDPIKVETDTLLTAIGETADFSSMGNFLTHDGSVLAMDDHCQVKASIHSKAIIYAGGDITDIPHTVVHAVASAKKAAIAMDCHRLGRDVQTTLDSIRIGNRTALSFSKYMGWDLASPARRNARDVVESDRIVFDYFSKAPSGRKNILPGPERKKNFEPYDPALSREAAIHEISRCLHCGRCTECDNCLIFCPDMSVVVNGENDFGYTIDYDYCKGCGICSAECPRSAITMMAEADPMIEDTPVITGKEV